LAWAVLKLWKKPNGESAVNYAATPYLSAMVSLDSVNDNYGADSGKSVVLYFLVNAGSFGKKYGEEAVAVKNALKAMVGKK
jgi:hypothetical protein